MFGLTFLESASLLALGAVFAAIFGFCSGWMLGLISYRREQKRRTVAELDKVCDELLRLAVEYWSSAVNDQNRAEMQVLAGKIRSIEVLLSYFVSEYFDNRVESLRNVIRIVTGSNFGGKNREPDEEQMSLSVAAIVNLRFSVYDKKRRIGK